MIRRVSCPCDDDSDIIYDMSIYFSYLVIHIASVFNFARLCLAFSILLHVIFLLEECPGTAIVGDAVALVIGCIIGYSCIFYAFSCKFNKNVEDGQILMAENRINGCIF